MDEEPTWEGVPRKSVLVVEDDTDVGLALVEVLEAGGFRAHVAGNGLRALEYLRTGKRPSLILLDMMMPVMDGWQFRRAQQQLPQIADIPVVVLTADGEPQQKAAALKAHGHIRKPASIEALLGEVERICGQPERD
jgi:CheY-like chemotaxis protein